MKKIILILIVLLIKNTILSQDIAYKLDQYMQATAQLNRFSGTVVIGTKDTIYLNKGYGYANKEHDISNSPQTIFRACSITKMITATAILQL